MSDLGGNPFALLFPSLETAEKYSSEHRAVASSSGDKSGQPESLPGLSDSQVEQIQKLNAAIQRIFLITLNKFSVLAGECEHLVYLSQLADSIGSHNQSWLDVETLEQALFERLMLDNPGDHVIQADTTKSDAPNFVTENRLVYYLNSCYSRCAYELEKRSSHDTDMVNNLEKVQNIIVQNLVTAVIEPQLYFNQNIQEDFVEIILNKYDVEHSLIHMLNKFADRLLEENDGNRERLRDLTVPVLARMSDKVANTSIILFSVDTIIPLIYFTKVKELAKILVEYCTPRRSQVTNVIPGLPGQPVNTVTGRSYDETLLGRILSKSCIPASELGSWEFFSDPSRSPASVHSRTEAQIWSGLESVHSAVHSIFNGLLRVDDEVKHLTLSWIGHCLDANVDRGKIWTSEMGGMMTSGLSCDGFMLNLGSVLLRFCSPFTDNSNKMDRVDPRYCSTPHSEGCPVHLQKVESETCLITLQEGHDRPKSSGGFNFPTHIFFLAHRALDLGFRTVQEKFNKLNQELSRLEGVYADAQENGGGPAAQQIQKRMEQSMTRFLNMKAALLEPSTLEKQSSLVAATCTWLVKLTTGSTCPPQVESLTAVPDVLACIPEFIIVNICEHILLIRRFNPGLFEQHGPRLPEIFQMILVLMGKPAWLRNPHLRARLAESLECLLPYHEHQAQPNILGNYQRQALFQDHPARHHLVHAILHVFVSIEETGQAVEFEQKFSYRRPMYDVIKYMWTLDEYKTNFSKMAQEAERNIESENPPLFLRFINLLINDAIFLLDEGLNYMRTLQEQEGARSSWSSLPVQERMDNERQYAQSGQLARYHNLMGSETIAVLELMTSGIKAVITHPTMTDRLAAMLNYFLKTLTGPERKSFKVNNLGKYQFKPGEVVANICQIYINLGDSEEFLSSVSADGRSYSPELFSWTEDVLLKIGKAFLVTAIRQISDKVAKSSLEKAAEDELLTDAPEEFLCPIMSILMLEPVILPSSRKIVDRSTISRHLLSDQSDPFNRSPLTMDQVKTDEELKARIRAWIDQKKQQKMNIGS